MRILGIETSCDETGAAVIEGNPDNKKVRLLSNVVASSLMLHAKTGGIIPEVAAREQIKYIIPVIEQALREAGIRHSGLSRIDSGVANAPQNDDNIIDAIAVTVGPGLIGSLLVGVETAKTLAYIWKKPIVPVNHLIGHIYANWLMTIAFPALALIVSGGHTDLVFIKNHRSITWIGGTRDDAAGEAFDKIGRLLGLTYPAGPVIAKLAEKGNPKAFMFPRPMIDSGDFDFSFSGLKTAVLREVKNIKLTSNQRLIADLSASVQQAIVDVLVIKTLKAAEKYNVKSILLSGGVAANENLRKQMRSQFSALPVRQAGLSSQLYAPPAHLCTDNGAMIAAAALFHHKPIPWQKITADPSLHFDTYSLIDKV